MTNPGMKFNVGQAVLKDSNSFELSLRFDNVEGAKNAVEAINTVRESINCPQAFNGLQLAMACAQLASATYSALKSAKKSK
ncbi:MAG: hypothetical protein Q4F00_08320 [bacterium]|nr:hypothetical protein [bacterium]